MNFRAWLYTQLAQSAGVTALLPTTDPAAQIYSDASMEKIPGDRPFVVIRIEPASPGIPGTETQDVSIWVHDNPGSYVRIDQILSAVRNALVGPIVEEGGLACTWQGDSVDLADDVQGTILRTGSFRLAGRLE